MDSVHPRPWSSKFSIAGFKGYVTANTLEDV